jgi:hypothetical protein
MDTALKDIESRGHATDIKVSINAGHLYVLQTVEDAKLFDTIMVQAGDIRSLLDKEDVYLKEYKNRIPPLELIINIPRGLFLGSVLILTNFQVNRGTGKYPQLPSWSVSN